MCCSVDEPEGHYAEQNKPVRKDKYCMIPRIQSISNSQNHRNRE